VIFKFKFLNNNNNYYNYYYYYYYYYYYEDEIKKKQNGMSRACSIGQIRYVCNIFSGKHERSKEQTEENIQRTLKTWVGRCEVNSVFSG
jgi:hypothetical protein